MALLTKKEFSEKCGIKINDLGTYVKRKKIILTGEHVNDTLEQNKEFLRKRVAKGKVEVPEPIVYVEKAVNKVHENENSTSILDDADTITDENGDVDTEGMKYQDLESLNKELDAKKKAQEIAILKIKKDKLHGIVIPTELIKGVLSRQNKNMVVEFSNSIDKIITKISKRKSLTNNEIAEIRSEVIEEINKASDKSIDETKMEVRDIVDAFSVKRGKGERT